MKPLRTLAVAAFALAALTDAALAADALPSYAGDPMQTSVSGLSSGAFMAVQYQVAYSGSVVGAGVVAGGPYYCAAGNILNTTICMGQVPFMPPNPALMVSAAAGFASLGQIDPLSNLQKARIYVFSGTKDTVNASTVPFNPQGCWDWFGYTGADYALKSGSQLSAVHAMVARLLSRP